MLMLGPTLRVETACVAQRITFPNSSTSRPCSSSLSVWRLA